MNQTDKLLLTTIMLFMILLTAVNATIIYALQQEENSKATPTKVIHIPIKQYPPPQEVIVPIDISIKRTTIQGNTELEQWNRQSTLDRANQLVQDHVRGERI